VLEGHHNVHFRIQDFSHRAERKRCGFILLELCEMCQPELFVGLG